jgi:hypothetical protein
MKVVRVYETDDWVRVFVDDVCVCDEHSMGEHGFDALVAALGGVVERTYIDDPDDFEDQAPQITGADDSGEAP